MAGIFIQDRNQEIDTIIGGIAPNFGPFADLGREGRIVVEVIMAAAILVCLGIAAWGAAKQRIGSTAVHDSFSAESGKGMIVRLYEAHNARGRAELTIGTPIQRAVLCDMLENELEELRIEGGHIQFDYRPFEILTIKVL